MTDMFLNAAAVGLAIGVHGGLCRLWWARKGLFFRSVLLLGLGIGALGGRCFFVPHSDVLNSGFSFPVVSFILPCFLLITYVIFFLNAHMESPTQRIVFLCVSAGKEGIEREGLIRDLSEDRVVVSRCEAMRQTGLLKKADGGWRLTSQGRRVARLLRAIRTILRWPRGE